MFALLPGSARPPWTEVGEDGRAVISGVARMAGRRRAGYGQDEDRRQAHDAGFDLHLTKPIEPEALLALVAEAK